MKTLAPIPLKASYFDETEKEIDLFFRRVIFDPLFAELKKKNIEVQNSKGPLWDALQTGRIYYDAGYVRGSFNASITSELRKAGAKYKRSEKAWHLPLSKASPEIKIAIQLAEQNMVDFQNKVISTLDSLDVDDKLKQYEFDFDKVAEKANKDVNSTLKDITVTLDLSDDQKLAIKKEWQENLNLYISEWSKENISSLRTEIAQNVTAGRRASQIERQIMTKYSSSKKKAKFLARQETSLLVSKIHETRYKDAGIFEYVWKTSNDERVRSRHKELDGKIFSFDEPPVVDLQTGRRANAGEDFNCRCVARPVIR